MNELKTVRNIAIDLYNPRAIQIYAKQYDKFSRFVCVSVYDNGTPVFLDKTQVHAIMKYLNHNEEFGIDDCEITDDGKIMIEISESVSKNYGIVIADISIVSINDASVLTTMQFCINVLPSPFNPSEIYDTTDFNAMYDFMTKALKDYSDIMQAAGGLIVLVKSVNGKMPDDEKNVEITYKDIGKVSTNDLSDGCVTNSKISNGIDGSKISDNTMSGDKLSNNTVDGSKLKDGTLDGVKLKENTVDGSSIKEGTIPREKLSSNIFNQEDKDNIVKSVSVNMDLNNNSIKNLADPVDDNDAVTKNYVDNYSVSGIQVKNVSVSSWVEETDEMYIEKGYNYKSTISIPHVTEQGHFPIVVFSLEDCLSGNYSPNAETVDNGVVVHSKVNDTITIRSILCTKVSNS